MTALSHIPAALIVSAACLAAPSAVAQTAQVSDWPCIQRRVATISPGAVWSGPDLAAATKVYRDTLGAKVSPAVDQPEHGVTTVFIELPNTKVELLGVLGDKSPIAAFLARNPNGGIHHLCYEVPDIVAARDRLVAEGARVLGQGDPKIGAHGKPVLFLHPKDFCGTLVELEEA